jgi:putative lipoprotein
MMRTLVLVGMLRVGTGDSWFGTDKIKHFFLSAFVQSLSYSVIQVTTKGSRSSLMLSASATTAAVGVGKEIHDSRMKGEFSFRDLAWDAAGIGAASVMLRNTRH